MISNAPMTGTSLKRLILGGERLHPGDGLGRTLLAQHPERCRRTGARRGPPSSVPGTAPRHRPGSSGSVRAASTRAANRAESPNAPTPRTAPVAPLTSATDSAVARGSAKGTSVRAMPAAARIEAGRRRRTRARRSHRGGVAGRRSSAGSPSTCELAGIGRAVDDLAVAEVQPCGRVGDHGAGLEAVELGSELGPGDQQGEAERGRGGGRPPRRPHRQRASETWPRWERRCSTARRQPTARPERSALAGPAERRPRRLPRPAPAGSRPGRPRRLRAAPPTARPGLPQRGGRSSTAMLQPTGPACLRRSWRPIRRWANRCSRRRRRPRRGESEEGNSASDHPESLPSRAATPKSRHWWRVSAELPE